MGYVFKKGGTWYTAIKRDGRLIKKSTGFKHWEAAKNVLRDRELKASRGEEDPDPITLDKFAKKYLTLQGPTLRPRTKARYEYVVSQLTAPASPLRGKMLHQITDGLVSRYVAHRLGNKASKATVAKELTWLRMALSEGARRGHISRTAVAILKEETKRLPLLGRGRSRRTRIIFPHEAVRLYRVIGRNRNLRDAVRLALYTGLRKGNILGLRERDLDISCDPAVIRCRPEDVKTADPLTVRLCPQVRGVLWRRWEGVPDRRLFRDFDPAWKRAIKRAGLHGLRFHDLRRSYITYRLAAGIDPKTVQDEVGHRDSRMTMDCYAQALKDPAVKVWAQQHFRFPWDPHPAGDFSRTTQIATHPEVLKRESDASG